MCGIVGWIGPSADAPPPERLHRMAGAVAHRGPDADGYHHESVLNGAVSLALGHKRLAIIDLDPRAAQPMRYADGRLTIVFNGEIYNYIELREELRALGHRFATTSDTEVLLAAWAQWGRQMFARLSGMYAFAVWDAAAGELVLARDPFGKKPLYLYRDGQTLAFASEIDGLLRFGAEGLDATDWDSIRDYLVLRYVPGPNTLFRNIRKLEPGTVLTWSGGEVTSERFWLPPDREDGRRAISFGDAKTRFAELLDNAVRLRMRSDAPFGAFLSGGLDSSAIVALMAAHSPRAVRTFSVGYAEARYSELSYARTVAERFGTDHTEVIVAGDDLTTWLPELTRHRGAPVSETADIPIFLMSRGAASDVKMVLTGEGSDEVLAGYPKHRAEALAGLYRALIPGALHRGLIAPLLDRLPSRGTRLRTFARTAGERDFAARMTYWFGNLSDAERDRLLGPGFPAAGRALDPAPFAAAPGQSALRRTLYFDQTSWLPDNLLERGDRMMMAASVEGRMPFLDRDLVAFAATLPDRHRLGPRRGKHILRAVMADRLPAEILTRRKVGFKVPVAEWFRTSMKPFVDAHLRAGDASVRRYLDTAELDRILNDHQSGAANHEKLIWGLTALEVFHRRFPIAA